MATAPLCSLMDQDVGKSDNGVQRRAQFMAHGGQERRFRAIGAFRLVLGTPQRGLGLASLRHFFKQALVDTGQFGGPLYHGVLDFALAQEGDYHALRQHCGKRQHQQRRARRRIVSGQRGAVPRRPQHQEEVLAGNRKRHFLMEFGIAEPAIQA